jgi:hypothetical protein
LYVQLFMMLKESCGVRFSCAASSSGQIVNKLSGIKESKLVSNS